MRNFIENHRNPKRGDVVQVLTHQCKLDPETTRKIADMMGRGDTETKEGNLDEQAGTRNREGKGRSNPVVEEDEIAARDNTLPIQHGGVKAEPRNDALEGLDDRRSMKWRPIPERGGRAGQVQARRKQERSL